MPDKPTSGPRRYVPVPGVPDIDAVEDANFADSFGEDGDDVPSARPAPVTWPPAPAAPEADPLGLPDPPPVAVGDDPPDEPPETPEEPGDPPVVDPDDAPDEPPTTPQDPFDAAPEVPEAAPPPAPEPEDTAPEPHVASVPEDDEGEAPEATDPASEVPAEEPADTADSEAPTPEAVTPEAVTPEVATPDPADLLPPPVPADATATPPLVPPRAVVDSAREATRSRGRELVQLVVRYGKAHVPEAAPKPVAEDTGPPRMVGRVGQLIPVLRVVPWLLTVVFVASFWWDFPGGSVVILDRAFPLDGLLRTLSVSGLIGFVTNWLAITMLFQPREKRAVIPQGLIPAQRERVIYRLSEAISRELINADIIKQRIQESGVIGRYRDLALGVVRGVVEDPGFRADLKELATGYAHEVLGSEAVRREVAALAVQKVEEQAGQGLGGVALKLYRTFAEADFQRRLDRALDELPSAVSPLLDRIDTALDAVPQKVEARADEIEEAATRAVLSFVEGFDVRAMIQEKARGFDEAQLEHLLKSTSNEQLNYIKYLGAILGVLGGLVIWQPLGALAAFAVVGLALWGLDEALVRARRAREGG